MFQEDRLRLYVRAMAAARLMQWLWPRDFDSEIKQHFDADGRPVWLPKLLRSTFSMRGLRSSSIPQ
jgi:hypothetical protein